MQECKGERHLFILHLSEVDFSFNLTPRAKRVRLKRTSMVLACGLTQEESEGLYLTES